MRPISNWKYWSERWVFVSCYSLLVFDFFKSFPSLQNDIRKTIFHSNTSHISFYQAISFLKLSLMKNNITFHTVIKSFLHHYSIALTVFNDFPVTSETGTLIVNCDCHQMKLRIILYKEKKNFPIFLISRNIFFLQI